MIKNKKLLYVSMIAFFMAMALNFPFPHKNTYGEAVVSALNIPVPELFTEY